MCINVLNTLILRRKVLLLSSILQNGEGDVLKVAQLVRIKGGIYGFGFFSCLNSNALLFVRSLVRMSSHKGLF